MSGPDETEFEEVIERTESIEVDISHFTAIREAENRLKERYNVRDIITVHAHSKDPGWYVTIKAVVLPDTGQEADP